MDQLQNRSLIPSGKGTVLPKSISQMHALVLSCTNNRELPIS
jgi:hypothetical protein